MGFNDALRNRQSHSSSGWNFQTTCISCPKEFVEYTFSQLERNTGTFVFNCYPNLIVINTCCRNSNSTLCWRKLHRVVEQGVNDFADSSIVYANNREF